MDVAEVRNAVLASEAVADRLRTFRTGRLADVVAGQTPVAMNDVATVVINVLPLISFDIPAPSVDLSAAQDFPEGFLLSLLSHLGVDGPVYVALSLLGSEITRWPTRVSDLQEFAL